MSNKPMCGVRDEHATANCCRTALNMTGWKDEGEKLYLIAMIDDATSRLTARFVRHDSTEENLRQLAIYVEQHGRPISVYTHKACFRWCHEPSTIVMLPSKR